MSLNGFWARLARSADNPVASSPSTAVASTGAGAVLTLSFVVVVFGNAMTYGASIVTAAGESPRTSDSSAVRRIGALAASIGLACCAYHASPAPDGRATLSAASQSA